MYPLADTIPRALARCGRAIALLAHSFHLRSGAGRGYLVHRRTQQSDRADHDEIGAACPLGHRG